MQFIHFTSVVAPGDDDQQLDYFARILETETIFLRFRDLFATAPSILLGHSVLTTGIYLASRKLSMDLGGNVV